MSQLFASHAVCNQIPLDLVTPPSITQFGNQVRIKEANMFRPAPQGSWNKAWECCFRGSVDIQEAFTLDSRQVPTFQYEEDSGPPWPWIRRRMLATYERIAFGEF